MATDGMSRWLASLDDERLTSVIERRLDRVHWLPTSFDQLASLLSQPQSCFEAVHELDRTAAQVGALLGEGGRSTAEELGRRLGQSPEVVAAALDRAEGLALAWPGAEGRWRAAAGLRAHAAVLLGRGPSYLQLLEGMRLQELRVLLHAHGLGGARSTRDAVDVLSVALPRLVPQLLAESPGTAEALREVALTGRLPEDGALTGRLMDQGLVLDVGSGVYLPAEVLAVLRAGAAVLHVEELPPQQALPPAAPPVDRALQLLSTATRLLDALRDAPVKALAAGGLGVQVLRRLAKATEAELEDVVLLLQLLAAAGLVDTGHDAGAVTAYGQRWRSLPEEQAYVQLVRPQLHPRARLEDPQAPPSGLLLGVARTGHAAPTVRQIAAASAARGAESDGSLVAWLDWSRWRPGGRTARVRAFAQPLHVLELLALRVGATPSPWLLPLLQAPQPGLAPGRGTSLEEAEADAACAPAAALLAELLPPAQDDVVLQADGTAFVAGRAGAELRQLLDQLGQRESEHTWRLHARGVREALDGGRCGEELLAELGRRARHGVPSGVDRLVRDVAAAHGRIQVHGARTVLRLADAVLGVELLHDKRLRGLGLVEVVPGVVSSSKPPAEVIAALRAAGHAPTGEGAAPAQQKPSAGPRTGGGGSSTGRTWGHDAREVVRHLRRAPAGPPPPVAAPPSASPAALLPRLRHLSRPEADLLLQAVTTGALIEIDYIDSEGTPTTRVVGDLEDTGHLLVGYCQLRQGERMFAPLGILSVRPATVS